MASLGIVLGNAVAFGLLIAPVAIAFVGPALLMWVWNLTIPDLLELPSLRYWQAFRVLLMAGLLFGLPRLI